MYKRRVAIFLGFIFLVFAALLVRLFSLQIVHGDDSRRSFEKLIRRVTPLPAMRGSILDNHGRIVARDNPCFELCMDYGLLSGDPQYAKKKSSGIREDLKLPKDQAAQAAEMFGEMAEKSRQLAIQACGSLEDFDDVRERILQRVQTLERILGDKPRQANESHAIATGLDDATAVKLKSQLEGTVGLYIRPGSKRWYPAGDTACHIIGFTGPVTRAELEKNNLREDQADSLTRLTQNYLATDPIGRFGVEKMCESILRGKRGYRMSGQDLPEDKIVEAQHGRDVHLTIDIELQRELTQKFRASYPGRNGCIVVLNVADGSVLAMVSIPTYDLNTYRQEFPTLVQDDYDFPLIQRAMSRLYEPGSIVKPVMGLAGLMEGVIGPDTISVCQGRLFPNENYLKCTSSHGPMDVVDAIRRSCNVFFYRVGEKMERRRPGSLLEWYHKFGFGEGPAVGMPGESIGALPKTIGAEEARMMAIGQGKILLTPLQVANAMATIARGGEYLSPILSLEGGVPRVRRNLQLSPSYVELVHRAMHGVTASAGGTGYSVFRDANLGFEVCGKSGTAQTHDQWRRVKGPDGTVQTEVLRSGHMAWFAGFAPYRNPQVAYAVVVEYVDYDREGGGAKVAGPLAVDALRACKEKGYIK